MSEVKEEVKEVKETKTFGDITLDLIETSKEYEDVSPGLSIVFLEVLKTFVRAVETSAANPNIDINQAKVEVFEYIVGYSIEDEFKRKLENYFQSQQNSCDTEENINNIDEDVLKSIKENMESYLES